LASRRFPSPWSVHELDACFFVADSTGQKLAYEASINFGARQIAVDYGFSVAITGILDRLTGRLDATTVMSDPTNPDDPHIATLHHNVGCEAT
jgi:hypothetical protein